MLGIGAVAGGLLCLFKGIIDKYKLEYIFFNPEILIWTPTLCGIVGSYFLPVKYAHWAPWTSAVGALLLPAAIAYTATKRNWESKSPTNFIYTLMFVWGAEAVVYQSHIIGLLTVGAVLAQLGFLINVSPFCYSFGFESDDAVVRGTAAGLALSGVFTAMQACGVTVPHVELFAPGALGLGSLAGGVGLLILSSRFHRGGPSTYVHANILAASVFLGGAFVSIVYRVSLAATMWTTFSLFYLPAKIIEVPADGMIAFGAKLLCCGGLLAGAWAWMKSNPELVMACLQIEV